MRILSLIAPMTQLNTPYPSTAYLTGFLRSRGFDAVQDDLALSLVLSFFTPEGLSEIHAKVLEAPEEYRSATLNYFLDYFEDYRATIAPTIRYLQGKDTASSTFGASFSLTNALRSRMYSVYPMYAGFLTA